ncbi:heme-binding domain-containing protein [Chryseobacterium luteum]|uniref:Cytochrome P460 n=1 Tax=Chryseobacterium luteum TaxID=421531 RepID=A0A085ZEH3_9FLAO|nr:cytochrome P460 family protein [Chryseobacterium luteum]KFF02837.1 cytochrome P460 [Chryseobacterium luteum]
MKVYNKIIIALLAVFILIQFFRPEEIDKGIPMKPLAGVPKNVNAILQYSCFDCHSSQTNWRWYDKITPANYLVASHIREGRSALDFSKFNDLPKPQQNSTIYYSVNKILSGEMPLPDYAAIHSSARLSENDIQTLKEYALSLTPGKPSESSSKSLKNEIKFNQKVKNSPNGLAYVPGFRNWKAISTTDRFDNGTMRIIYGNDVAVKAIENENINPWPDGAVLAKAAWKENVNADGNISIGNFVQVELMVKDSRKYAKTKGWGWGRWKGTDLKPYGDSPDFDKECIECHKPMKNRDYTFTSPLYLISQLKKIQK